jgi:outer membrane receptor for ferrienterochelin and colicins
LVFATSVVAYPPAALAAEASAVSPPAPQEQTEARPKPSPAASTEAAAGADLSLEQLDQMSLEQLMNIPVTVATKTAVVATEAPSIVTVIPRSTLAAMGYRSVGEALRSVPGFFVIDDLITNNIGVRGIYAGPDSWSRILKVMVNGHPATYNSTGGTLLGPEFLPISAVESIEVIRGPGSALYGANAFLGVINVVTRKPHAAGARLSFSAEGGRVGGNWSDAGEAWGSVAAGNEGKSYLTFAVRAERTDRSGLSVPAESPAAAAYDAEVSQNDLSRPTSVFVGGAYDLGPLGTLEAQYQQQILDAYGEFSSLSILTHDNRVALSNEILGADHRLSLLNRDLELHTYATYTHGDSLPRQQLDAGSSLYTFRRERPDENTTLGSELSLSHWGQSLLVGFEYQQLNDRGETTYEVIRDTGGAAGGGNEALLSRGKRLSVQDYALFAQLILHPLERLALTAGVRQDWNDTWKDSLNPRLALVYRLLDSLSAKAVYGTSYVPPAPAQLSSSPLRFDGGIVGNPDLKSQRAKSFELEMEYRHGDVFNLAINGFYTEIDDRAEFVLIGNQLTSRNLTTSHSVGGEATGKLFVGPVFSSLNLSYQHTTADTPDPEPPFWHTLYSDTGAGGSNPLYFPTWMGRWELGVNYPKYYIQASAAASYIGARKSSAANIIQHGSAYTLPSYVLVDLTIRSLDLKLLGDQTTTVSVHVNNLLDQRYAEGGYLGVDIPGLPRSVFVMLQQEL